MPRNPLANPLFLPVFLRVVALIVVGLAAVVLSQRRSLQVWRRSTLFLRARTWFVIGPLFVLAVFIGGFVAFLLATFVVVKSAEPWGLRFLVIVTVSVALSDIAAYAAGSALRGRTLM
ncbi:MAG TPA: hypothetical protein VFC13_04290, partial [Actinomycetes bacterium]|nr:hypothetical protein [Actinomycetes bacterium]